ncbi:glycosyltransferase family 90 protein, partial [Macrolepiota fuliginosa MF-IS2]
MPSEWPNKGTHTGNTCDVEHGEPPMVSPRRRGLLRILLARYKGALFLLVVILLFLHAGFSSSHNSRPDLALHPVTSKLNALSNVFRAAKGVITKHPIPKLMDDADDAYRAKLGKQSKSLEEAVAEYRKRYKRDPPRGFDEWWAFARENKLRMVDEFDGLMSDLEPFWALSGEEIRRRTQQAGELPSIHLVRVKNGESTTVKMNHAYEDSEVSARAHGFRSMISKFEAKLPDMDFAVNAKAEGRVLVSWDHRTHPNTTLQDSSGGINSMLGGPFVPDWGNDGNIWEAWRRTCPPDTPARKLFSSLRNPFVNEVTNYLSLASPSSDNASTDDTSNSKFAPRNEFQFMSTTNTNLDFCTHPHLHTSQGHFFSDWRTLPALYPVFTPARAQGFMDIRIPSHYYYGSTQRYTYGWDPVNLELKDVDPMEVPWEDKLDKIFWRGATTGGGSHPPGFAPQYQRHRFLRMSSDQSNTTLHSITFSDPPNSNRYLTSRVPAGELNKEVMDVAFVKAVAVESYPGGREALRRDHRFGEAVPLGEHWRYRYLVDLDGMSYSGRFLAFLASDSVPIKSTVYEEWFGDWIQPWVHFIPLSATYKEIYNIHAYFSGPTPSTLLATNATSYSSSSPSS